MVETQVDLPDFRTFMEQLQDPDDAREFLLHLMGIGYEIPEVPAGADIRKLSAEETVSLAQMYFGIYYLEEFPYGEDCH